jgi:hypothetical protein
MNDTSRRSIRICAVAAALSLLIGCAREVAGTDSEDSGAYLPGRDAGLSATCTMTTFGGTAGGQCRADWVCPGRGRLTLACDVVDGGVACLCGESATGKTSLLKVAPPSCSDPAALAAFVRSSCGWTV